MGMFGINRGNRQDSGSASSGNDSSKKEKSAVDVLEPSVSNAQGQVLNDNEESNEGEFGTKRDLKARHVSMIALAGTIGTGLFLGSGAALANGGPVGFFLGYTIVGCLVGMMMYGLGEM